MRSLIKTTSNLGVSTVVYQMKLILMVTARCLIRPILPQFSAQADSVVEADAVVETYQFKSTLTDLALITQAP